jgi:hypothetical protein
MTQYQSFESSALAIDERQQAVINEARFFEPYKEELENLFGALGRESEWSDDPSGLVDYIRPGWIGFEHGNSTEKDQFTTEQSAAAMLLLHKLGLVQETLPPDSVHFNRAIDVGGTLQADVRRGGVIHKAVTEHGVIIDVIDKWDGQRPRESRDGTNKEIFATDGRFAGYDIYNNSWVREALVRGDFHGNEWALTEAQLGRIAMLKLWGGHLLPHRVNLELLDKNNPHQIVRKPEPGVPARIVKSHEFVTDEGQLITIQNAAAVSRGDAPSRHTTRSSAIEWLQNNDIPQNAQVLFVSSNPHTLRTAQDTHAVLQEQGRGDIQLVVAGASAPAGAPIQLFLGEVGRLIDNDVKRNYEA